MGNDVTVSPLDRLDRQILGHLVRDGRATYQELSREVRLSASSVAERVRHLRASGVIRGYRAELDAAALGRPLTMVSEVRLRESTVRREFAASLAAIPQIVAGSRLTGDYDYELRLACRTRRSSSRSSTGCAPTTASSPSGRAWCCTTSISTPGDSPGSTRGRKSVAAPDRPP